MAREIVGVDDPWVMGDNFAMGADPLDAWLSGEEIVGDAQVMSLPQGAPLAQQAAMAAQVRAIDPRAVQVRTVPDTAARIVPIGLKANVAANGSTTISTMPQHLFRPERLTIPSTIAPFFEVQQITIGTTNQVQNGTPIPGEQFSEVGVGVGVNFGSAEIGQEITVNANNLTGQARDFRASILGTIVKPPG